MKRHVQETGIRKWFGDDLVELQSQPLKAIDEIFKPYSSCVISGCEVANGVISPGLVAFVWDAAGVRKAKVVPFSGAEGIAVWPQYLYLKETPVTREYQGGGVKNIAIDCKAAIVSAMPVEPFVRILATGPEKTFRDVIQSSVFRFVTDTEKNAWNAKWHNGSHPITIAGYGITDMPTNLPASDVYPWAKATTKPSYSAAEVGLGNVTNESKATMFTNPVFTGTVTGVTKTHVGLGNVTNESKATMFTNPVFTGTVTGVTKTHVGLGNVTNESKATMFTRPVFSESAKVVDNNPIMEIQSNSAGYLNAPVTRKLKWSNFAGDESGNINLFDFSQESVGTEMAFTIKSHANGSLIEALRINGFGKIGIGTTAPEMPLDVCGAFGLPANTGAVSKGIMRVGYYQHAAWGGTELNFGIVNDNTLGYPSWIQSQMPGAYENNRPLLLNPNGGNVGIGTNNPGSKLDVNGEIRATSFVGRAYPYTTNIGSGADVSDTHMLAGSTSGQKAFVDVWGGNNASYQNLITFGTSSFERMRIAANGNVGIGTTNPTQSLDVNGTIIANDIIIR